MAMRLPDRAFLETVDELKDTLASRLVDGRERRETLLLALKIANLFVVKRDYRRRRINVAGRPLGFMLDPANGCNLGCATCANTSNKEFAARVLNAWPRGTMKADTYSRIIDDHGPWAWVGHFYNNSEPYLNKNTHEFIKRAAQFRVRTSTSSHLSLPKLDVEAIVESGLDELQIAIDGVTQEVYQRYRRGGEVELAFENVRRLVQAKRARNSSTPFIRWHYLTFQHNVHEVDAAMEKARDLGVDL